MVFHLLRAFFVSFAMLLSTAVFAEPVKIVAVGDSLTAGFGLARDQGFVPKLQAALIGRGHDVVVVNAGVSGDTTSGGRSRLDWSVGADADAVILELGANDALRGLPPETSRANIDAMVAALTQRDLPVLLAGMLAPPNLGTEYGAAFNSIYPDIAEKYGVLLYPFFLDGVAGSAELNQPDGIHPTAEGVDLIVERILPSVEELLATAKNS